MTRILFITPLFLLLFGMAGAQVKKPVLKERLTLSFERYDGSDGLSQGLISCLLEDRDGYLWLGTMDGLNRFDGKTFKVFRHDEKDSTSIPDNYIRFMQLDADGRLWISTRNGNICYYNPETEDFTRYKGEGAGKRDQGLGELGMMNLMPDNGVMVWAMDSGRFESFEYKELAGKGQIAVSDPVWFEDIQTKTMGSFPRSGEYLQFDFDAKGNFWMDRMDSVFLYSGSGNGIEVKSFGNEFTNDTKRVWAVLFSDPQKDNIYWSKNRLGRMLWKYNYEQQDFVPFMELPEGFDSFAQKFIDSKNRLWSWVPNGNILVVDLNDATYIEYETQWSFPFPRTDLGGRWFEDSKGNMWFGTDGYGLLKFSSTALKFKRLTEDFETRHEYTYTVRTVKPGQHAVFDPKIRQKFNQAIERLKPKMEAEGLEYNMQLLTVDQKGDLLFIVGSRKEYMSYVIRVDTATFATKVIATKSHDHQHWGWPTILDSENNIWCGERRGPSGQQIYRVNLETGVETVFDIPVDYAPLDCDFLSDWHEDTLNRKLWFATAYGLFCYHKSSDSWSAYVHDADDPESISSTMVLAVLPDPERPTEILWVGAREGGLNRLDISTGKFKHFKVDDSGQVNDGVIGILADKHKQLWFTTDNGLCQFDPQTGQFRNYFVQDGLSDGEFNGRQYSVSPEGEFYFGGVAGWLYFNPEDFYQNSSSSKLVFTGMKLWNKPVLEIGEDAILKKPLAAGDAITLSYENNMVTIDFALLDLTAPHRNRYKYQMEGLSDNWVELGNATEATFTNLDPGKYTLRVLGCNSSGVWTEQPSELIITILPPWYATWWFRSLMAFVLASLLYAFYRYRLAQLLRMERMRNRIAQDLHDEIGSTISSISLFGSVLKNTMRKDPDKADKLLDRITTYSSQIGERMNDMVWTIKADNDSFEHVVNRMRAYAVAMTESKGVKLNFAVDSKVESLSLEMEIRKNIYLIFKEAVNNAVKYSNCSEISVEMQLHGKRLELSVKDNGVGFDKEAVTADRSSFGGNGLNGMRMRAREMKAELQIETWPKKGTEIKLEVGL